MVHIYDQRGLPERHRGHRQLRLLRGVLLLHGRPGGGSETEATERSVVRQLLQQVPLEAGKTHNSLIFGSIWPSQGWIKPYRFSD